MIDSSLAQREQQLSVRARLRRNLTVQVLVAISLGILLGDVTGDGVVNRDDIVATKSYLGEETNSVNFRADVNTDGFINHNDVRKVTTNRGHTLL